MNYTNDYRNRILQRLLKPGGPSAMEISRETGIHHGTLYRWMHEAKNGQMSKRKRSPRNWSLEEKYRALLEAQGQSEEELGRWLREQGLHGDHLKQWEKEIETFLRMSGNSRLKESEREIKSLRKELERKDKALAEMSALVVLKKKFQKLLEEQ